MKLNSARRGEASRRSRNFNGMLAPHRKGDQASRALIAGRCLAGELPAQIAVEFSITTSAVSLIKKAHELSGDLYLKAIEAADRYYESHPRPSASFAPKARKLLRKPVWALDPRANQGGTGSVGSKENNGQAAYALLPAGAALAALLKAPNASDRPASNLPEFPSFPCSTPGGFPTFQPPSQPEGGESMRYVYSQCFRPCYYRTPICPGGAVQGPGRHTPELRFSDPQKRCVKTAG